MLKSDLQLGPRRDTRNVTLHAVRQSDAGINQGNFKLKDLHASTRHATKPKVSPKISHGGPTFLEPDNLQGTQRDASAALPGEPPGSPGPSPETVSLELLSSQAERGETEPEILTFEPDLAPETPRTEPHSLLLETRGVTSHPVQSVMWERELIWKESILAKLRGIGKVHLAGKMAECHTVETFKRCTGCRKLSKFFNRCELFFCPVCAPRLSRERKQAIEWWTHQVNQPKHLVLTVRNTMDLTKPYVQFLKAQLAKLRRSKVMRPVKGGFYSMEVTNEGRGWHVHFHLLIDAPWLCMPQLSETWGKLVGQDFAIVKIKDCRGQDYLKEVTKYAVKGSELSKWVDLAISEFIEAFDGVRFFGVFGSLYGKRTEWKAWIEAIREIKPLCACGCSSWTIMSPEELLWEQETSAGMGSMPPPRPTQVPNGQADLPMGGQTSMIWPD